LTGICVLGRTQGVPLISRRFLYDQPLSAAQHCGCFFSMLMIKDIIKAWPASTKTICTFCCKLFKKMNTGLYSGIAKISAAAAALYASAIVIGITIAS